MGTISIKGADGQEISKKKVTDGALLSGTEEDKADIIKKSVLTGNKLSIVDHTKQALTEGRSAEDILNSSLLPGINEVGKLFETGRYFLPQLIASAEAMRMAIEYLEPYLKSGGENKARAKIVIATVKGDIHDIGKNLVALMLKNYGFEVYDLGKDVSKEDIVAKAKETDADIIALSALMTTTMQEMREVIRHAREEGVRAQVMIGGAVITQDYADEISASGYSKDAQEAVKLATKLIETYGSN
jgi:5-methyltetrahydrofolate--homocysteine methyltransferase